MPWCAAVNCSNSAKKGFLMKRFPRDPERRKQWLIKMRRDKWTPTDHSCLCEVHFAPEMWERTREDGSRKLRINAVPTVFPFSAPKSMRKPPSNRVHFLPPQKPVTPSGDDLGVAQVLPNEVEVNVTEPQPSTSHDNETTSVTNENSENNLKSLSPPRSKADFNIKLNKYEKMYLNERKKVRHCKNLLRNMERKFKCIEKTHSEKQESFLLKQIFNKDQIMGLEKKVSQKSTKFMKWSNPTITKALKLKFSCGNNGYNELLKQGQPLPSIRTIQRRLQNLKFDCGILNEVFEFMKIKVRCFEPHERDAVLVLDEMAITPGSHYDTSMSKYFGDVTLPEHTGIATHVLVFLLGGVTTRWKQVVAYYFTSDSVNGSVFSHITEGLFRKAEEVGLNILSITSDMGPSNQALWRTWAITAGRFSETRNKIPHPLRSNDFVYIFADIPHLFKNIKGMLITNKVIVLPDHIVEKHGLPSNQVLAAHVSELVTHQKGQTFQLAPKLTEEDLLPSHFAKMKVSTSTNVVSHSVSSALTFLAEILGKPEYLTTAWFLNQVEKWFYLMTSRHPSSALSKFNPDVYNTSVQFLEDFIDLFDKMAVGNKKIWKPSQTGVLISTRSMLEVQQYLLDTKGYTFVLTSRFSQDCLENLFSVLRSKQIIPNALQVKNNLKLISVSQYLTNCKKGSYDEDDREFLCGFLGTIQERKPQYQEVQLPVVISQPPMNLSHSELNSLYNISGYILHSIMNTTKTCSVCKNAAGSLTPIYKSFSRFTNIKRFRENTLFFCSEELFYFFLEMEAIFVKFFKIVSPQNINIRDFYCKEMSDLEINLPNCHGLKKKIISRFVIFRLKISSKKCKMIADRHASKSLSGHL